MKRLLILAALLFPLSAIAQQSCGNTIAWNNPLCQQIGSGTLSSQWTVISRHGEYGQDETECNIPSAVSQSPGLLTITASASPYTCGDFNPNGSIKTKPASWPYSTGDIQMNTFNFSPNGASGSANCGGTCTITVVEQIPSSATNLWPGSFWLLGSNCQDANKWSGDTGADGCPNLSDSGYREIDPVECYNSGGWCQFHVANPHFGIGGGCDTSFQVDTNYHTYKTVWTASSIQQYMDGKLITTCNQSITNPLFMIIQIQTGGAGGTPSNSKLPATLNVKSVSITAQSGAVLFSDNFSGQSSNASSAQTATALASLPATVTAGSVITLSATVTSLGSPVKPGMVKFCDATAARCEDAAVIGTAQLNASGTATYKLRPGIGAHSYKAMFVVTKSYAASSSTTSSVTVTGTYPTTSAITSSGLPGSYTLAGTVVGVGSPSLGPTGTLTFLDTTNNNASLGRATLGTAAAGEYFAAGATPGVGTCPNSVAVGDFNGDGIPDMATANSCSGTVTVLLGNGDGTFATKSSPAVTSNPVALTVGDFNSDGIPDLAVVSNSASGNVTVLLGNGDGTFTSKYTSAIGTAPSFITAGDFNQDGIPDLAIALSGSNVVTVLLGAGDGTFTVHSSPAVGNEPYSVAVADFNGDGIPDLATANYGDNTVTVLLGKGDGTFTSKSTPSVGDVPYTVATGDFNGDGIADLVTANQKDNTVTVLLGDGDGTFTLKSTVGVGNSPSSVAVSDFNRDGKTDIATSNIGDDTVTVLLGNADGTFAIQSSPAVGSLPLSMAAADFNGDGNFDVATANQDEKAGNSVSVLLNRLTETSTAKLSSFSLSGTGIHNISASYSGNTNYASSTSGAVVLLAAQIATTLSLASTPNPSALGASVGLTAILTPYSLGAFSANGESVTFRNGTTVLGTTNLLSGIATLNVASLPAGTDTLTATYTSDGNFAGATSNSVTQNVQGAAATPVFNPPAGTYMSGQKVTISDSTAGATIYYTTNGSLPTTSSSVYGGPITLSNGEKLQAIAGGSPFSLSPVATAVYYIATAQPQINPPSGIYSAQLSVTITDATPGSVIYYTTNGAVPSKSSPIFTSGNPIIVNSTETIKALAVAPGLATSPEGVASYTFPSIPQVVTSAPAPMFNVAGGYYFSSATVTITDAVPGATIYYTTNGTTPTTSSTPYTVPVTISSTAKLQAMATATNYLPSAVTMATYNIAAAQPQISPRSGTYTGTQMVTITDATPGAVIYYTTDGSVPSRSSPIFTAGTPIVVSASTVIKALAVAPGYTTSPEGVASYAIIAGP